LWFKDWGFGFGVWENLITSVCHFCLLFHLCHYYQCHYYICHIGGAVFT